MKLNSVLTLLFIALFTACKGGAYDLSGYGLKPDTGENASPLIAKALQEIAAEVNSDTVRILLPKGRYDFYPEGASKRDTSFPTMTRIIRNWWDWLLKI